MSFNKEMCLRNLMQSRLSVNWRFTLLWWESLFWESNKYKLTTAVELRTWVVWAVARSSCFLFSVNKMYVNYLRNITWLDDRIQKRVSIQFENFPADSWESPRNIRHLRVFKCWYLIMYVIFFYLLAVLFRVLVSERGG